jgi:hypothetical protein
VDNRTSKRQRAAGHAAGAVLAACGILGLGCGAASAATVQARDVKALDALHKRSFDLTQALTESEGGGVTQLNATGDPQTLDCIETLREASNQVTDQLMDVDDVAAVARRMKHPTDRGIAAAHTARAVGRALNILPVEARQVNQTAGLCLTQSGVQDKAREQLQLINDAIGQLQALRAKLTPGSPPAAPGKPAT